MVRLIIPLKLAFQPRGNHTCAQVLSTVSLCWGHLGTSYVTDPKRGGGVGCAPELGLRLKMRSVVWGFEEVAFLPRWPSSPSLPLCPCGKGLFPSPSCRRRQPCLFPFLLHCRLCTDHLGKTQQSDPNFRKTSLGTQLASAVAHVGWADTISDSTGGAARREGLPRDQSVEMDRKGSSPFCSPVIKTHQVRLVCTSLLPRKPGCRLASWNPNYDNRRERRTERIHSHRIF